MKAKSLMQFYPLYLGVDVAGQNNTWIAGIRYTSGVLAVDIQPCMETLQNIRQLCMKKNVVAVAIDAQLSLSISDENGFRKSDEELKQKLPRECRNWVASVNSLMAVPVRGQLLAGALDALVCATIAYLYHHQPDQLKKLKNTSESTQGYGPFYVIDPELNKSQVSESNRRMQVKDRSNIKSSPVQPSSPPPNQPHLDDALLEKFMRSFYGYGNYSASIWFIGIE